MPSKTNNATSFKGGGAVALGSIWQLFVIGHF
jgi:hypothetical protein